MRTVYDAGVLEGRSGERNSALCFEASIVFKNLSLIGEVDQPETNSPTMSGLASHPRATAGLPPGDLREPVSEVFAIATRDFALAQLADKNRKRSCFSSCGQRVRRSGRVDQRGLARTDEADWRDSSPTGRRGAPQLRVRALFINPRPRRWLPVPQRPSLAPGRRRASLPQGHQRADAPATASSPHGPAPAAHP